MTVSLVLGTGARGYLYPEVVHARLDELYALHGPFILIHGACGESLNPPPGVKEEMRGVDRYMDDWGRRTSGIDVRPIRADWWGPLHKGAGPARNAKMVREAVLTVPRDQILGLAFPGPRSTGTWDCITRMRNHKIEVDVWGVNRVHAWLRNKRQQDCLPNERADICNDGN